MSSGVAPGVQEDNPRKLPPARILIRVLGITFVFSLAYFLFKPGIDWEYGFRPAALSLLQGRNPYEAAGSGFYNPPWAMVLFVPLALLPVKLGSLVLTTAGFIAYIYIANRLGGDKWTILAFIVSPAVALDLAYANITWMVLLGYLMPPNIGLFFVLLKPQVGLGVAIYWLFDALRRGGIKEGLRVFGPVSLAYILSFLVFGNWLFKPQELISNYGGNTSLWPYTIPVGLILLILALNQKKINFAYMVGPFLSPYVTLYSWQTVQMGLFPSRWVVILSTILLWLIYLLALGVL